MTVGLLTLELYLPEARSRKDRRRGVQSLKDRLHNTFNVSVAETDHHDLRNRAQLGVAVVTNGDYHCREILDQVLRYCRRPGPVQVVDHGMDLLPLEAFPDR